VVNRAGEKVLGYKNSKLDEMKIAVWRFETVAHGSSITLETLISFVYGATLTASIGKPREDHGLGRSGYLALPGMYRYRYYIKDLLSYPQIAPMITSA